MNPLIFRKYDIRGIVGKDLTEDVVCDIGRAFGTYILKNKKRDIILGRDIRPSSKLFRDILVKALTSTGCNVFDIGEVPIPVYYFSIFHYKADGGIYITGSHNPTEYNGFKINLWDMSIFGEEIQKLRKIAEKKEFIEGCGKIEYLHPTEHYVKNILNNIKIKRRLKIVVDCGNGTNSLVAPNLFENIGCEVVKLYCEPDGAFPNHLPDPTIPENLKDLRENVMEENADFGVAYDGDGDRIGVIDDKGNILWGDRLLILFSREVLKKKKSKILVEVKCSQSLIDDIKAHNGTPILCPTGHSLIKHEMKKQNAVLAGEMSGHIFFADEYFGFDDAIYATCRLIRILSKTDKKLSQMFEDVSNYYSTPEIRVDCRDEKKFSVVEKLKKKFMQKYKIIDIDGIRIIFKDGWALIRASNTEPKLILRFESKTKEGLEDIENIVRLKLKEQGLVL